MRTIVYSFAACLFLAISSAAQSADRPNIVLVMADDMGWGQTSYYNHPLLKTPNLDAMAENGLRFDRFYAGAPVCSPTRASVLTGRSNDRTGVLSHGYPLRLQEKTVAQALKKAGYATGHFGKWHLNGLRGPGVPVLDSDDRHPGKFGFETWLSVTNFFDRDPIMSRNGSFEEFEGDSSEIIIDEALKFMANQSASKKPFFAVVWYGTPHSPFRASEADKQSLGANKDASLDHYGELVAMDRSIGTLREGLRKLNVADDTLFWFCSDNGGLPKIKPETVGGLRGNKGTIYEGGLRVPAVIEWPRGIKSPRVTKYPASTMDIFPTLATIVGLPSESMLQPQDGSSLQKLLNEEIPARAKPIPFRHTGRTALVDNQYKLLVSNTKKKVYELYDLVKDPAESRDIASEQPEVAARLQKALEAWNKSVDQSIAGKNYPEGKVTPAQPEPRFWTTVDAYKKYFPEWKERPEYSSRLKKL